MARIQLAEGDTREISRIYETAPSLGVLVQQLGIEVYEEERKLLPPRVREAARVRIAHHNGCNVCIGWRIPELAERGVTEELYCHVHEPGHPEYSAAERLAIEYADRFAADHRSIDEAFFTRLRAEFTDEEIAELTILCAFWSAFGRLTAVLDLDEACAWSAAPAR